MSVETQEVGAQEPAQVLSRGRGAFRCYWSEAGIRFVGLGAAAQVVASGPDRLARIREAVEGRRDPRGTEQRTGAPVRWVGGWSFRDDHASTGAWSAFPSALFVLPRVQYTWTDEACHETIVRGPEPAPETPSPERRPHSLSSEPEMTRSQWSEAVRSALQHIERGELSKVVLARSETRPKAGWTEALVPRLEGASGGGAVFMVEPRPGHVFFGSSPEPLIRLEGDRLETVALGGSAPRGRNPAQDEGFRERLLASSKDALEHDVVVQYLEQRLADIGARQVRRSPTTVRTLPTVQHLETRFVATPPGRAHVLDLAARLHPTPAVCGIPPERAARLIQSLEPTPRGWYAGGVGWFDSDGNGSFATAIRSGLSGPEGTRLFAGAGIVKGSEPDTEWAETVLKLNALDALLTENPT